MVPYIQILGKTKQYRVKKENMFEFFIGCYSSPYIVLSGDQKQYRVIMKYTLNIS
jgi:hypothetical protein